MMIEFVKMPAGEVEPGDTIARTKAGADAWVVRSRVRAGEVSVWITSIAGGRIRPHMDRVLWVSRPAPALASMGAGTACSGRPWHPRGAESAETWADTWNALAERRSEAAAAAGERVAAGVTFGSFVRVAGQGSFGALGGSGTGRPALVDETGRRWGYFPASAAYSRWSGYDWQNRSGIGIRGGWHRERTRRQEAAATAGGTGWQTIGGVLARALLAGEYQPSVNPLTDPDQEFVPLSERDDGVSVCLTAAGADALARLRWYFDGPWGLAERPRYGSEDDLRERLPEEEAVDRLAAGDLHDLSRCLCVRCSRERRQARAHAEAAERVLRDGAYRAGGADAYAHPMVLADCPCGTCRASRGEGA